MSNQIHFGNWLKRQIEERLMTQNQFAENADIPFATLRTWIQFSKAPVRGVNIVKLSRALGMTRDELEALIQQTAKSAA